LVLSASPFGCWFEDVAKMWENGWKWHALHATHIRSSPKLKRREDFYQLFSLRGGLKIFLFDTYMRRPPLVRAA
jgi:hypothetical protein